MTDRTVHHERALVGLAIQDPSSIDRVELDLAGYDWLDDHCREIFPALVSMRRRGDPISDLRNVALNVKNVSATQIGLLCVRDGGLIGQDAYHLQFLKETSERSKLLRVAGEIQSRANDTGSDLNELREWIAKQLYSVSSGVNTRNAGEIMQDVIDRSRKPTKATKVLTGLYDIDNYTGGFLEGQLVILAARPSVGKSALASQIAVNAARSKTNVLFVSLEMTSSETVARVLASETECDMRSILNGNLTKDQALQADRIASEYKEIPLMIEDRRGLNMDRLAMLIRSTASKKKLGMVVVDYLGLIAGDKRKPRWESITDISNQLKTLAQTESIPILALCQLNRDSEGEIPKLSNLRDSGSIEQDADIVLLLHREKRDSKEAEVYIAKNRNGPTGRIQLKYNAERFEFQSWCPEFSNDFR